MRLLKQAVFPFLGTGKTEGKKGQPTDLTNTETKPGFLTSCLQLHPVLNI